MQSAVPPATPIPPSNLTWARFSWLANGLFWLIFLCKTIGSQGDGCPACSHHAQLSLKNVYIYYRGRLCLYKYMYTLLLLLSLALHMIIFCAKGKPHATPSLWCRGGCYWNINRADSGCAVRWAFMVFTVTEVTASCITSKCQMNTLWSSLCGFRTSFCFPIASDLWTAGLKVIDVIIKVLCTLLFITFKGSYRRGSAF